jgi:hypothetical protein
MNSTSPPFETSAALQIVTAKELAPVIKVRNEAAVLRLARRDVIPSLRLGYRTVRFNLPAVLAALSAK